MIHSISLADALRMMEFGEDFGRAKTEGERSRILGEAAEFYIRAEERDEARMLFRFWWREGFQKYVQDQREIYQWVTALDQKVRELSKEEV